MMEPSPKRIKVENTHVIDTCIEKLKSCENLKAVVGDEFEKPLPLVKVYVGHVKDPKNLSRVIALLNEKIPLKDLSHLKRVRKREVILCPSNYLNGMSSIQEYLEINVQELRDIFEYFKEIDVPMIAPKVRKQYNLQVWSCNFHPNKYYEKLISDNFFAKDEMKYNITYMHLVFEALRWNLNKFEQPPDLLLTNAAVIVDPMVHNVVAISFQNHSHPVQHSAMVAIDSVAKTQNGGAWGETSKDELNCTLKGIDAKLLQHLRELFPSVRFGARPYISKRDIDQNNQSVADTLESPYLCTGYYVYMLKEPCVMCSMALVHARAKRIFFCFDNVQDGALKSRTKLQTVQSLNHHFEVFTGFFDSQFVGATYNCSNSF